MNRRFEDKYLLNLKESHDFMLQNMAFLVKDFEAIKFNSNHCYQINSLYYDTDNFLAYNQKINGDQYKFKLRVRDYAKDEQFLELKLKEGQLGYKYRILIKDNVSKSFEKILSMLSVDEINKFQIPLSFSSFKPVLNISYKREAYRIINNRNVKVNLDSCIIFDRNDLKIKDKNLTSKVLEIKYTNERSDKLLNFNRIKSEYSKYQRGVEDAYFL